MRWRRVQGMEHQPNCCAACGGNPATLEGNQTVAYWAEGVDIDWGSMLYLCEECVQVLGDLSGRATKEGFDSLTQKHEALLAAHAELEREHEVLNETVEQIRAGAAASKRLRETARSR